MQAETIREHLEETGAVILQGPPGTGKSWLARKSVGALVGESDGVSVDSTVSACQWTRLVERYGASQEAREAAVHRPVVWDVVHLPAGGGVAGQSIVELAEVARAREREGTGPTVLIFDEIQRSNLADVLGEVAMLIDPHKRSSDRPGAEREGWAVRMARPTADDGEAGTLEAFSLPESLGLLGTWDTADDGAAVDYALHRRFRFVDVMPSAAALRRYYGRRGGGKPQRVASEAFERMNDKLVDILPASRLVGHTYFMVDPEGLEVDAWCTRLARKLAYEVIPLLRAYDLETIELTLTAFDKAESISVSLGRPAHNRQQVEADQLRGWLGSLAEEL